jgi:hypothetical protein
LKSGRNSIRICPNGFGDFARSRSASGLLSKEKLDASHLTGNAIDRAINRRSLERRLSTERTD